MLFNSYEFILLFPICLIIYFLLPNKYNLKKIHLILCSYYFYCFYNIKYGIIIFSVTAISYIFGILAGKFEGKRKILIVGIFIILSILFVFKYLNYTLSVLSMILGSSLGGVLVVTDIVLPMGISFYTMQAISYMVDVYKKRIKAEKNFINYALYISFFPQLVAGPIERANSFIPQIKEEKKFDYCNFKTGMLRMLFGFFEKLVIADRAAIFVDLVYGDISSCSGFSILIATFIFGIQIYCDFSGYSNIAIGAANILGFKLSKNFDMPYFSSSVTQFWNRWHITFSLWLKDYIYIPLGGNRCSKIRKNINLIITFIISGIWHGANVTFLIWGIVNGFLVVLDKSINKVISKLPKIFNILFTYILINLTWIFFRAKSVSEIGLIFKNILCNFSEGANTLSYIFINDSKNLDLIVLILGIVIMVIIEYIAKKKDIFKSIFRMNIVFRWLIYYVAIFSVIIFGVYGLDSDSTTFIYALF